MYQYPTQVSTYCVETEQCDGGQHMLLLTFLDDCLLAPCDDLVQSTYVEITYSNRDSTVRRHVQHQHGMREASILATYLIAEAV